LVPIHLIEFLPAARRHGIEGGACRQLQSKTLAVRRCEGFEERPVPPRKSGALGRERLADEGEPQLVSIDRGKATDVETRALSCEIREVQKKLRFKRGLTPVVRQRTGRNAAPELTAKRGKGETQIFKKLPHEPMDRKILGPLRHDSIVNSPPCQFKEIGLT
jgi:hypothetical protein